MQINRKTIGASSAVRLFVGDIWLNSVALGSSSDNIRTSENLRELFNRFELTKNRLLKIPAEFRRNYGFLLFQLTLRRSSKPSEGQL